MKCISKTVLSSVVYSPNEDLTADLTANDDLVYELSPEDEKAFAAYLDSLECYWWHWIENFWMIVDPHNRLTALSLRDALLQITSAGRPSRRFIVVDAEGSRTWGGAATQEEANWLPDVWERL